MIIDKELEHTISDLMYYVSTGEVKIVVNQDTFEPFLLHDDVYYKMSRELQDYLYMAAYPFGGK